MIVNKVRAILVNIIFIAYMVLIGFILSLLFHSSVPIVLCTIYVLAKVTFCYYNLDKFFLASIGAKPLDEFKYPNLKAVAQRLIKKANISEPKIYIKDDPALNVFTIGRDPDKAAMVITSGLIENLEPAELESILAHEISHILLNDIHLKLAVNFWVFLIFGNDLILHSKWLSKEIGSNQNRLKKVVRAVIGANSSIGPFLFKLLELSVPKEMEFRADRNSAKIGGSYEGLTNALQKIDSDQSELKVLSQAMAHHFIANPFNRKMVSNRYCTQPSIKERINKLNELRRAIG